MGESLKEVEFINDSNSSSNYYFQNIYINSVDKDLILNSSIYRLYVYGNIGRNLSINGTYYNI